MSEGNGVDIAAVYQLLSEVARMVAGHDRRFDGYDRRFDEITARLDAHDRRFDELVADIAGLRETLTHYHASVLGHGVLISDLEERVRRIERHLNLAPAGD